MISYFPHGVFQASYLPPTYPAEISHKNQFHFSAHDYPAALYPVCAALQEARGRSDHLTQAAAVDTRVAFEMKI